MVIITIIMKTILLMIIILIMIIMIIVIILIMIIIMMIMIRPRVARRTRAFSRTTMVVWRGALLDARKIQMFSVNVQDFDVNFGILRQLSNIH